MGVGNGGVKRGVGNRKVKGDRTMGDGDTGVKED